MAELSRDDTHTILLHCLPALLINPCAGLYTHQLLVANNRGVTTTIYHPYYIT